MLFVHGGSYLYGTGNIYNGTVLAMLGVLIVTVNYRLDTLGTANRTFSVKSNLKSNQPVFTGITVFQLVPWLYCGIFLVQPPL